MSRRYTRRSKSMNGWYDTVTPTSDVLKSFPNIPEDMDDWGCSLWILYYKEIKKVLGKDRAVEILEQDSERVGMFSTLHNTCKFDCGMINFFKSEGIPTGNFITNTFCAANDVVVGAGDVASGAGKAASSFAKLLPVVMIGGIIVGGVYVYNNVIKKTK